MLVLNYRGKERIAQEGTIVKVYENGTIQVLTTDFQTTVRSNWLNPQNISIPKKYKDEILTQCEYVGEFVKKYRATRMVTKYTKYIVK